MINYATSFALPRGLETSGLGDFTVKPVEEGRQHGCLIIAGRKLKGVKILKKIKRGKSLKESLKKD